MTEGLQTFLLDLYGGDPFADVYDACQVHREDHGPACGVFPSNPVSMRIVSVLIRATGAKHVLEVGCGIGYSGLHLASSLGPEGSLDTIERVHDHALLARKNFDAAGLGEHVRIVEGDAAHVLKTLSRPYDFVYDDGWFAKEPPYLDAMLDLIRPDGLLVMANWFLLDDTLTGTPRNNWSAFAGKEWAEDTKDYARKLAAHPRVHVAFDLPLLAVGVKV